LKEHNNRWYVIGWDESEKDIRTFGLDRIKSIELLENPYRKSDFDPREYFKYTIGIIAPQSKPPQIKIEFTKQQAQYLITQPIHPSQKILKVTKEMVIFGFVVHPTYEFISLLFGYRDKAKVLSPVWLKNGIRELLEQMIKQYE
jgi:predicted DNA-binding transcriptional regulator YafY